ncbi:hypothetical protein F2P81_007293 [Scophthalmus maximus]|uniref:Uncharacterized protein n=1 Tax=Scophthalmus maximus TaxID=52904 RepID=A0A6A4T891_SCOMX|nr:hypothetical protein F2P81_007293 [Scophthalmus maximus]
MFRKCGCCCCERVRLAHVSCCLIHMRTAASEKHLQEVRSGANAQLLLRPTTPLDCRSGARGATALLLLLLPPKKTGERKNQSFRVSVAGGSFSQLPVKVVPTTTRPVRKRVKVGLNGARV